MDSYGVGLMAEFSLAREFYPDAASVEFARPMLLRAFDCCPLLLSSEVDCVL